MFAKKSQWKQRALDAEEKLANLQNINEALVESFSKTTTLIDIDVRDKSNIFTLQRDGQVFYIETYHMMGDNVELWRKQSGIET